MGLSEAAIAEAKEALARAEASKVGADNRAEVCGCGHTMAKHDAGVCYHGYQKCRCAVPIAVLKVPNARVFSYRNDEAGPAVVKGIGKTVEMGKGHRLEWVTTCREDGCEAEPDTVVSLDGGKRFEPRCGAHR